MRRLYHCWQLKELHSWMWQGVMGNKACTSAALFQSTGRSKRFTTRITFIHSCTDGRGCNVITFTNSLHSCKCASPRNTLKKKQLYGMPQSYKREQTFLGLEKWSKGVCCCRCRVCFSYAAYHDAAKSRSCILIRVRLFGSEEQCPLYDTVLAASAVQILLVAYDEKRETLPEQR